MPFVTIRIENENTGTTSNANGEFTLSKFEGTKTQGKPQQTVAPAGRSESSGRKRQVKLTKSEVEMARRLNVPVQEYAKYIKR